MMARIRTFGLEVGADSRVRGRDLPLEGTKAFGAPALSAEQNGPSGILVTWSDVSGDSYSLEVSTNGGSTWDELVSQSGTSYTHSGVSFPGTYLYRVRATKDAVVSDYSNTETVSMVDVPAAPGGLTVTGATTSSISLSWNDTVGEESFTVEESVDGLGSWTSAGSTSQNVVTFTHSGLPESVQRYYRVVAYNKAGGSLPSSTTNTWTVPAAPTGLTATAISTTQIDLSWTDVSTGNTSYKVERSTDNVNWTEIATGLSATATTYSATGLSGATQYWFRVRAANAARNSDYSSTATATTTLAAPSGLTATATSSTQINLSWTDNSANEDGFKVERSTDNSTWTEIAGNVAANSTTYSATGLTASTLYYFRVRAYRGAVNSAYTSSASATTQSGSLSPSWTLDFSSGSFSGATLTRASTGTYVDSSGYVASASTDIARLTHDSSGSRLGLLVEESRTNSLQRSADFANAYWTKRTTTIDNNGGSFWTAPDNASTAVLLEQVSGTDSHNITSATFASQTNLCFSVFAKKQTTSGVGRFVSLLVRLGGSEFEGVVFDLDQGTVTQTSQSGGLMSSVGNGIENYGNGWYRCHIRGTRTSSGNVTPTITLTNTGTPTLNPTGQSYNAANSTDGVYIWGAQYETVNQTPSSYIPTTTAAVTRSADLAHVLDSSITSWGDPGALVVHFYPPGQAGTILSTDDAATAQVGIEASTTTAARAFWSSGSTSTGTIGSGVQKAVHYWNGSTSKFAINGGAVQSGTNNLTIANTDFVTLGAEATESGGVPGTFSQYANCIIRKVEFYSGTLTDANLQTITT